MLGVDADPPNARGDAAPHRDRPLFELWPSVGAEALVPSEKRPKSSLGAGEGTLRGMTSKRVSETRTVFFLDDDAGSGIVEDRDGGAKKSRAQLARARKKARKAASSQSGA